MNHTNYAPEAPHAPNLNDLNPEANLTTNQHGDNLTSGQDVQTQPATTVAQAIEYIKRTKQVINALHEHIELQKQLSQQRAELLRHCLNYIEQPKPRNKDLIIKAIQNTLATGR